MNALFSIIASIIVFAVGVNLPANLFALPTAHKLGNVGVTTISTATNLANFPAIYNTDLPALDAGKIDNSTTSVASIATLANLSSVGTLTTGVWNATAISVGKGGTGTTSPSQYFVLLGNGASGITIASTTGTSGQFLTSNGSGAYPSWQTSAVNLGGDYTWTGKHIFTASTTISATTSIAASDVNNKALILNGAATQWPSSNSLGLARNNGSGVISWGTPVRYLYATTTAIVATAGVAATSTVFTIPANTITASSTIHFSGRFSTTQGTNTSSTFYFRDTNNNTYASADIENTNASGGYSGTFDGYVYVGSSVTSQTSYARSWYRNGTASPVFMAEYTSSVNLANATSFIGVMGGNGGTATLSSLFIEVNP